MYNCEQLFHVNLRGQRMHMIATFEAWSTGIYRSLNEGLGTLIAPLAHTVERKLEYWKTKRDTRHSARIARALGVMVAGEEVVTMPNILSALRPILMLFVVLPLRLFGGPTWLVALMFAVTIATDKLDGAWALIHGHTRFGEVLDPICDKLALMIFVIPDLIHLPVWITCPLLFFEAALFTIVILAVYAIQLGILSYEVKLTANIFGKVKFTIEVVAMSFLVFHGYTLAAVLFGIATPFACMSAVRKATDIIRSAPKAH